MITEEHANGRLCIVQSSAGRIETPPAPGIHILEAPRRGRALLYVPKAASLARVPLLAAFHSAGGSANDAIDLFGVAADRNCFAILAPDARGITWDMFIEGFGRDVAFFEYCLQHMSVNFRLRWTRAAIAGFSDGASFALSLGLINGDCFDAVIAFSPGRVVSGAPHGKPRVFISHGVHDSTLPIDECGRPISSRLRREGYATEYREFDGGHEVPGDLSEAAIRWWAPGQGGLRE